jgi:hypothetical protein
LLWHPPGRWLNGKESKAFQWRNRLLSQTKGLN